jgi:hypothetical protein
MGRPMSDGAADSDCSCCVAAAPGLVALVLPLVPLPMGAGKAPGTVLPATLGALLPCTLPLVSALALARAAFAASCAAYRRFSVVAIVSRRPICICSCKGHASRHKQRTREPSQTCVHLHVSCVHKNMCANIIIDSICLHKNVLEHAVYTHFPLCMQ